MDCAGLDYLSSPTGAIKEAQELAAAAFGADETWFLVNGTTVGIQAAIMATCGPEDALIVARNCHLAAFSAMALSGCHPIYVMPGKLLGAPFPPIPYLSFCHYQRKACLKHQRCDVMASIPCKAVLKAPRRSNPSNKLDDCFCCSAG